MVHMNNDFKKLIQEFDDILKKYNPVNFQKLQAHCWRGRAARAGGTFGYV